MLKVDLGVSSHSARRWLAGELGIFSTQFKHKVVPAQERPRPYSLRIEEAHKRLEVAFGW